MAHIVLENLVKRFGSQTAVKELNLEIKDREFVSIFGPSGCGKTTTMNMISGLLKPDSGKIYFDGRLMTDVPPGKRGVGFMFQNYAVFTHMNVYKNVAFGLLIRKQSREEMDKAVRAVTKLLQIDHLLGMNAGKLSINDMQKVALARSIVVKPKIFLLDEPLSNLDAALRSVMRVELKKIQQELGQTSVYVTHDQVEAMSLSDRIAVMNHGIVEQIGAPQEIYDRPATMFVADFIGSPPMNLLLLEEPLKRGDRRIAYYGARIEVPEIHEDRDSGMLALGVRPEHVEISDAGPLRGRVFAVEYLGTNQIVTIDIGRAKVKARLPSTTVAHVGDTVGVAFQPQKLVLFDASTGRATQSALFEGAHHG